VVSRGLEEQTFKLCAHPFFLNMFCGRWISGDWRSIFTAVSPHKQITDEHYFADIVLVLIGDLRTKNFF
jgi:hypothetical protein